MLQVNFKIINVPENGYSFWNSLKITFNSGIFSIDDDCKCNLHVKNGQHN